MLFGHVKGAFTGAAQARPGLLKEAHKGILFLDEIQDLAKPLQRKLVRVFQDRQHRFRPVGGDKEESVDIEVVCASNRGMAELQAALDADLFDRLSHLIIQIPPLRECRDDLPDDWQRVWRELRRAPTLPDNPPDGKELGKLLASHDLPGNLRDLQHLALLCMAWWQQGPQNALDKAIEEWRQREISDGAGYSELGEGNWQERVEWFKQRLAHWAKNKTGGWSKAAKLLKCTERTLRNYEK
jgi:DNA-binding NtrC family response regulator